MIVRARTLGPRIQRLMFGPLMAASAGRGLRWALVCPSMPPPGIPLTQTRLKPHSDLTPHTSGRLTHLPHPRPDARGLATFTVCFMAIISWSYWGQCQNIFSSVRNRWNRLKEMGIGSTPPPGAPSTNSAAAAGAATIGSHEGEAVSTGGLRPTSNVVTCAHGGSSAACSTLAAEKQAAGEREKPERISWSRAEDETILRGVSELGHKWNKITERLPGRTDHAIRNRFHRLQTLLEDRQRQQQRSFAPAMPLPTGQPVEARAFKGAGSELSAAIGGSDSEECTGSGGGFATPGS